MTRKIIKNQAKFWSHRAQLRSSLIKKFNWDEELGLYFDYDFVRQERRIYRFGTTFLPLWTGLASQEEAERVCVEGLKALELPGGLSTSDRLEGDQWDRPYVWAPLQLFAIDGLRRYGLNSHADRLAANFDSMVLKTWLTSGRLWEKYDGLKRDESVDLKFGYPSNEEGFGWTNALFTRFYDQLKSAGKEDDILLLDGIPLDQEDRDDESHINSEDQKVDPSALTTDAAVDSIHHHLQHADLLKDVEVDDWIEVGVDTQF